MVSYVGYQLYCNFCRSLSCGRSSMMAVQNVKRAVVFSNIYGVIAIKSIALHVISH